MFDQAFRKKIININDTKLGSLDRLKFDSDHIFHKL